MRTDRNSYYGFDNPYPFHKEPWVHIAYGAYNTDWSYVFAFLGDGYMREQPSSSAIRAP
jgi:hypothetical protein